MSVFVRVKARDKFGYQSNGEHHFFNMGGGGEFENGKCILYVPILACTAHT